MTYGRGGYGAAAASYKSSRVMSSTPVELVVMLHERLLADLRGAVIAIDADNLDAKASRIQSANDVIFELLSSLDRSAGGEVSDRLAALYGYMIQRIGDASRTLDVRPLKEVEGHVESLLEAWSTLAADPPETPHFVPGG
ncbi:MAG: flagellar export chaperone FliS [Gemmatimonadota bacterium]